MANPQEDFSKIYDQYINKIYRFILLRVNSQGIAEDLTSETFVRGWKRFKGPQQIKNIQAFLYQIARNLIVDHYRDKSRASVVSADNVPVIDPRPSINEITETKSDLDLIKSCLANLKEEYQEAVILRYVDDLSISEIAHITNKSEGAVRVTLHRALNVLQEKVQDNCNKNGNFTS